MGGEADGAAESKVASAFVSGKLLIGGTVGGLGKKDGQHSAPRVLYQPDCRVLCFPIRFLTGGWVAAKGSQCIRV